MTTNDDFGHLPINNVDVETLTADSEKGYSSPGQSVSRSAAYLSEQAASGSLQWLDVQTCIKEYAQDFVTSRGGLVLVLDKQRDELNTSTSSIYSMVPNWKNLKKEPWAGPGWCPWDHFAWICGQDGKHSCGRCSNDRGFTTCAFDAPCHERLPSIQRNIQNVTAKDSNAGAPEGWRPFQLDRPVKYCLSEQLPEQCQLQAVFQIWLIVVILNAIKATLMCLTLFSTRESPLMTVGDAIASFLERPDSTSHSLCLVARREIQGKRFVKSRPTALLWKTLAVVRGREPNEMGSMPFIVSSVTLHLGSC